MAIHKDKKPCVLCNMLTHNEQFGQEIAICDPCFNKFPSRKRLRETLEELGLDTSPDEPNENISDQSPNFICKGTQMQGEITFTNKQSAIAFIQSLMDAFEIETEDLEF